MGNLVNALGNQSAIIKLENPEEGLIELISFDLDFTENEEYFREDTLELGYKNEADRLVKEYLAKNQIKNKEDIEECCSYLLGEVFNSNYYGDYTLDVVELKNKSFKVITTYQY